MKLTTVFNVLAIAVVVAQAFGFTGEVNPEHQVIVTGIISLINLGLYVWKQYGNKESNIVRSI